jgi:hypothetical protein
MLAKMTLVFLTLYMTYAQVIRFELCKKREGNMYCAK